MVARSKLVVLRGSHVLLVSLFIFLLFCNWVGLLPFVMGVRSHLVFRMSFGLSFWLRLVFSSLVVGRVYTSMSKLVFAGLPVVGGIVFCWLEKLRIFFRWFTLRLRLVANITVGQIARASVSGFLLRSYFGVAGYWVFIIILLISAGLLLVELGVGFIQAYLFCLLLSVYSSDHSL